MTYTKAISNNFISPLCASRVTHLINSGHDGMQFVTHLLLQTLASCSQHQRPMTLTFHVFHYVAYSLNTIIFTADTLYAFLDIFSIF